MPTFAHLDQRRSVPSKQLSAPGPDHATLLRMLASAVRVPDHGKRVPFRFIRIQGDDRHALGRLLEQRTLQRDPDAGAGALEKERNRFSHAPLIMAVLAEQGPDEKIPPGERLATAACVCFALLQAAQAAGFGAQWLTGWAATDPVILNALGVHPDEALVGFIHIGSAQIEPPERERPDPARLLSDWHASEAADD